MVYNYCKQAGNGPSRRPAQGTKVQPTRERGFSITC